MLLLLYYHHFSSHRNSGRDVVVVMVMVVMGEVVMMVMVEVGMGVVSSDSSIYCLVVLGISTCLRERQRTILCFLLPPSLPLPSLYPLSGLLGGGGQFAPLPQRVPLPP